MTDRARDDLRRLVSQVLDAFVDALDREHGGTVVTVKELRQVAQALESSTFLDAKIGAAYHRIRDEAAREVIRNRRREPFKRLMVDPMTRALNEGLLGRDMLPNYFNFLHLVLGDETESLSRLCVTICKDEHHDEGVDWDRFYADDRAKYVFWTVLHRIAASFRRFDVRRDWFISLMQNRQTAVSLGSNIFVPLPAEHEAKEPHPFGPGEFNTVFAALFGPLRNLSIEDAAHFGEVMNGPPESVFGEMWANLERVGAAL